MEAAASSEHVRDLKQTRPAKRMDARFLALFAGLCFAISSTRFSAHPLLHDMARSFGTTPKHVSLMVSLNQAGTIVGLLLFVPLADGRNQRKLASVLFFAAALAIFGMASAPTLPVLLCMSFCLGLTLSVHHVLTPWAVSIGPAHKRGQVVGSLHAGTVAGTLTGVVFAGAIATAFSWRAVYGTFGCAILLAIPALIWIKPPAQAATRESWQSLAKGALYLLREPKLRETALMGGLLFCAYHTVWLSLTLFLHASPYHFKGVATGLFASIGLVGVLISPLAGRWMDRFNGTTTLACSLATVALGVLALSFAAQSKIALVVGLILLDLGVRSGQVIAQARIYRISSIDYARATTVYMIVYLLGGAIGASLSSLLWGHYGWRAICLTSFAILVTSLVALLYPHAGALIGDRFTHRHPAHTDSIGL